MAAVCSLLSPVPLGGRNVQKTCLHSWFGGSLKEGENERIHPYQELRILLLRGCLQPVALRMGKLYLWFNLNTRDSSQKQVVPQFSSVDSLGPHGLQHAGLSCSSPSPGACSNSCPSSRWCHPTISSSVVPFSSCLQSFTISESFLWRRRTSLRIKWNQCNEVISLWSYLTSRGWGS